MQLSHILGGIALLASLVPVTAVKAGTDMFKLEARDCEANACSSDSECDRKCTEGCLNGRCASTWADPPSACGPKCVINRMFKLEGRDCEANACSSDSECDRKCTEGCLNGRCASTWADPPSACGPKCVINKLLH